MPASAKHPAILHKDHHVTQLILWHVHQEVGHSGRNHALSRLRQTYWLPGANSAVRRVITKCVQCKKLSAIHGDQKMADLPQDRLLPDEPPFTYLEVDYFGPFEVKRGRATVKRYGVIFTCLTLRAVHIEVAHSLDTDSCINAIPRFIARRGQVKLLRSDNGTNFVGANRELQDAIKGFNGSQIQNALFRKRIT